MSGYIVSNARITAIPRPTRAAELLHEVITGLVGQNTAPWVGSRELDAMARATGLAMAAPRDVLAEAAHRRELIESSPMAAALLRAVAGSSLKRADRLISIARRSFVSGNETRAGVLVSQADELLRSGLAATAQVVRVDERHVVGDGTIRALTRLGYKVRSKEGSRSTGIVARTGSRTLLALVQDGGVMEVDTAGCGGDACKPVMAEFTEALKAEGLDCNVVHSVNHGDDRGGQLIGRSAAAAPNGRLEEGAVIQFERGVTTADSAVAPSAHTSIRRGVAQ